MNNFNKIPSELQALKQWVLWGKDKMPFQVNGKPADCTKPETWNTFEAVVSAYNRKNQKQFYGIGFEFSKDDPYCGIDLDHCIENGVVKPEFQKHIESIKSYTEYSPSGNGIHIIAKVVKDGFNTKKKEGTDFELYTELRYFTFTGNVLNGFQTTESRDKEVKKFYQEVFGSANVIPDNPSRVKSYPKDDVKEQIRTSVDMLSLAMEYGVIFKKHGKHPQGLCIFHPDKETPSFTVYPETNSWHCFGCGKGGDNFKFIELAKQCDFKTALKILADRAGIDITRKPVKHDKPEIKPKVEIEVPKPKKQIIVAEKFESLFDENGDLIPSKLDTIFKEPDFFTPKTAYIPIDLIPEPFCELFKKMQSEIGCSMDYLVSNFIANWTVVVGKKQIIEANKNWTEYLNMYIATVGEKSDMKSTAADAMNYFIDELQNIADANYETAWTHHELLSDKEKKDEPEPVLRQYKADDVTGEALVLVLRDNDSVVLQKDELTGLFKGLNKYTSGQGDDREMLLKVYKPSSSYRKNRVKGGYIFIKNPFLSTIGNLLPEYLPIITGNRIDDGMLSRYIFFYPEPNRNYFFKFDDDDGIDIKTRNEKVMDCFHWFDKVPLNNQHKTVYLHPNDGSKEIFNDWINNTHYKPIRDGKIDKDLKAQYLKLQGYTLKFIFLFHTMKEAANRELSTFADRDTADRAIKFTELYLKPHTQKALNQISRDKFTTDCIEFLNWLKGKSSDEYHKFEIRDEIKQRFKKRENIKSSYIDDMLLELTKRGFGFVYSDVRFKKKEYFVFFNYKDDEDR